jgi:hypothetical protein
LAWFAINSNREISEPRETKFPAGVLAPNDDVECAATGASRFGFYVF